LAWGLISVVLGSIGQTLIKLGSRGTVAASLSDWRTWLGLFLYGLAFLTWLRVLALMPLSRAYPLLSLNFILITLFSAYFLKESVNYLTWLGVLLCVGGILIINVKV